MLFAKQKNNHPWILVDYNYKNYQKNNQIFNHPSTMKIFKKEQVIRKNIIENE